MILDSLAVSMSSPPEVTLSLLAPALRRVLLVLLSCPWLRRLEGSGEVPLLDSDLELSLSFRLSGFGGMTEVYRSRGVGIELTEGVDWAAGSGDNDDRDRLKAVKTLKAVGG